MVLKREKIVDAIISIAITAGKEILKVYESNERSVITKKGGHSPQTEVDLLAHTIISNELKRLDPLFPIFSEESDKINVSERMSWDTYWLIDPLDGTKEFINRTGQFTVNIALVEKHLPILGVVYAPVENTCYFAYHKGGAYKDNGIKEISITSKKNTTNHFVVAVSNDEKNPLLNSLLSRMGSCTLVRTGSSIKICLVADGTVDLYPRLFPTSEWDTAAAHCVLLEADGDLYLGNEGVLRYNKPSLLNPSFFAISQKNKSWLELFSTLNV